MFSHENRESCFMKMDNSSDNESIVINSLFHQTPQHIDYGSMKYAQQINSAHGINKSENVQQKMTFKDQFLYSPSRFLLSPIEQKNLDIFMQSATKGDQGDVQRFHCPRQGQNYCENTDYLERVQQINLYDMNSQNFNEKVDKNFKDSCFSKNRQYFDNTQNSTTAFDYSKISTQNYSKFDNVNLNVNPFNPFYEPKNREIQLPQLLEFSESEESGISQIKENLIQNDSQIQQKNNLNQILNQIQSDDYVILAIKPQKLLKIQQQKNKKSKKDYFDEMFQEKPNYQGLKNLSKTIKKMKKKLLQMCQQKKQLKRERQIEERKKYIQNQQIYDNNLVFQEPHQYNIVQNKQLGPIYKQKYILPQNQFTQKIHKNNKDIIKSQLTMASTKQVIRTQIGFESEFDEVFNENSDLKSIESSVSQDEYEEQHYTGKFKSQVVGCKDENGHELHLIDTKFDQFKQRQFSRAREIQIEEIHSNDNCFMANGISNFLNIQNSGKLIKGTASYKNKFEILINSENKNFTQTRNKEEYLDSKALHDSFISSIQVDQAQREQKLIERNLDSSNFFNKKNKFIDEEPCNYVEKKVSKFNDQNRISSFDCQQVGQVQNKIQPSKGELVVQHYFSNKRGTQKSQDLIENFNSKFEENVHSSQQKSKIFKVEKKIEENQLQLQNPENTINENLNSISQACCCFMYFLQMEKSAQSQQEKDFFSLQKDKAWQMFIQGQVEQNFQENPSNFDESQSQSMQAYLQQLSQSQKTKMIQDSLQKNSRIPFSQNMQLQPSDYNAIITEEYQFGSQKDMGDQIDMYFTSVKKRKFQQCTTHTINTSCDVNIKNKYQSQNNINLIESYTNEHQFHNIQQQTFYSPVQSEHLQIQMKNEIQMIETFKNDNDAQTESQSHQQTFEQKHISQFLAPQDQSSMIQSSQLNEINEEKVKRRRNRKSPKKIRYMQQQLQIDPDWSKETCAQVAQVTGLSESQVYKWGWDQKNKLQEKNQTPFMLSKSDIDDIQ